MNPFEYVKASEYKEENFFPCITDEYRECVRNGLRIATKKVGEKGPKCIMPMSVDMGDPFNEEKPDYGSRVNQPRRCIEEGSMFDITEYFNGQGATSLVRCCLNNGGGNGGGGGVSFQVVDPVRTLKGKHVMVACTFVPNRWCGYNAEWVCRLWVLSQEMAHVDDFELIIVAKMRNKYELDFAAYNQFLSGFPNRLAVSFDNPDLRDELCYHLGFLHGELDGIVIDPYGKIVQSSLGFLLNHGASSFPFTDTSLEAAAQVDMSLAGLLRCHPSTRLHKLGFPSESITVEQLSKKLVGLYLFRRADKLVKLHEAYRLSRLSDEANGIEPQFEMVLFCLPVAALDPATFETEVHAHLNMLKPYIDASSWWVYPYDNSAGLRLAHMAMTFSREYDAMFAVGPNGTTVDFCGGEFVRNVQYEAYPFSLKAFIQRFVDLAEQITLESLFTCGTAHIGKLVKQDGSHIDLKELQYKKVFLYVDTVPSSDDCDIVGEFLKWYLQIKQREPDVEMVFVSYTHSGRGSICRPQVGSEIPWIVCPYHPELSASLRHHFGFYGGCDGNRVFKGLRPATVTAFGKGGRIQLLNAECYSVFSGFDPDPFSPKSRNLKRDIYVQMNENIDFLMPLPASAYLGL